MPTNTNIEKPKVKWQPQPVQIKALQAMQFEVLFGGARGGGKTDTMLVWLLYDKECPILKALVIRKNATDLKDWTDRAWQMWKDLGVTKSGNPVVFKFPSGYEIVTGHLKDDNAYEKYQGHEYQKICIEELTQIPSEDSYEKLISSCRSTIPNIKPQIFCTTNPGGIGHGWVKKRWQIKGCPQQPILTKSAFGDRVFIPARVDDNQFLMQNDPRYILFLDGLKGSLKKAWRDGDWEDFEVEGAIFGNEYADIKASGQIGIYVYDKVYPVHTVFDLGVNDTNTIIFFQKKNDKCYIIDYYQNHGVGLPHYKNILQNKNYIYGTHYAPFDIKVKEWGSGITRLEKAKELGIDFEPIQRTSIENKIEKSRLLFSAVFINEINCGELLEALRCYQREYDENNQTYKDNPLHNWASHAADAFQYLAQCFDKAQEKFVVKQVMQNNSYFASDNSYSALANYDWNK